MECGNEGWYNANCKIRKAEKGRNGEEEEIREAEDEGSSEATEESRRRRVWNPSRPNQAPSTAQSFGNDAEKT